MKEPLVARALRIVLYVVFFVGLFTVVTLPFLLEQYAMLLYDAYYVQEPYRIFLLTFLMTVGALGLFVVGDLILVLHTIPKDPFIRRNVRALRRIGAMVLVISLLFFLKCLSYVTFLTLVCGIAFLICSLVVFTVALLFARAVGYKEENELTI